MEMRTAMKSAVSAVVDKIREAAREMPKKLGIRFCVRPQTELSAHVHTITRMTCNDVNDPQKVAARLSMLRDDVDHELGEMEVLKFILHSLVAGTTKEVEGIRFTKGGKQFKYNVKLIAESDKYTVDTDACREARMPGRDYTVYQFLQEMGLVKHIHTNEYVKATESRIQ